MRIPTVIKENLAVAILAAMGLTLAISVIVLIIEGWTVNEAFRNNPYEIWQFLIGIPVFLTIAILGWLSAFSIKHRGWKRLLLLSAGIGFLATLIIYQGYSGDELELLIAGCVVGLALASIVIVVAQEAVAILQWVKAGFDDPNQEHLE